MVFWAQNPGVSFRIGAKIEGHILVNILVIVSHVAWKMMPKKGGLLPDVLRIWLKMGQLFPRGAPDTEPCPTK